MRNPLQIGVVILVAVALAVCFSDTAWAQRSGREAVAARQRVRAQLARAMADGKLSEAERCRILSNAKSPLSVDELGGLWRTLDRLAFRQKTSEAQHYGRGAGKETDGGRATTPAGPFVDNQKNQARTASHDQPVDATSDESPFREETFEEGAGEYYDFEGAEYCGESFCGPPGRFWMRADYLLWWTSGTRLPMLVSTGTAHPDDYPPPQYPVTADPVGAVGYIDEILFGDSTVNMGARSNFRVKFGVWLNCAETWGLEGDYFTLGGQATNFSQYSPGTPVLARPYYDVQRIGFWREIVAYPDAAEGTISAGARDYFQSAGIWGRYNLCASNPCGAEVCSAGASCEDADPGDSCDSCEPCDPCVLCCCRLDLIAGYRYYHLDDSLVVNQDIQFIGTTQTNPWAGFRIQAEDRFRARNDFHGAEVGLLGQVYRGRWSLELLAKMAIGTSRQVVTIDGNTVVTAPPDQGGEQLTYDGAILALRSNMGTYIRNDFVVIPQLGLELGYQLTSCMRAYAGYNLLYWSSVGRAAEQVDLNIDPRNIPPAGDTALPFPAFPGRQSSFWAQGINLGLELRY